MDYIEQLQNWEKAEVFQGKIMMGIGILVLIVFIAIFRGETLLLRGMLVPLGLLWLVLIGYGGYILKSRPIHVEGSIAHYTSNKEEAVKKEIEKHENDNKAGKTLLKVYPILLMLSALVLWLVSNPYYKGMALGFALLFIATHIIDNGFVSRSDQVIAFLK